jgi:hypothetical protein
MSSDLVIRRVPFARVSLLVPDDDVDEVRQKTITREQRLNFMVTHS